MADNGARFRVIVTNVAGSPSAEAVVVVTTDHLPEPQIVTPPVNSFYNAGDVLSFSGSASDVEDGNLPASALSWRIDYHHDVHTHPFLPETSGISSGTVTIPSGDDVAADVWYRVWLTARDSQGLGTAGLSVTLSRSEPGHTSLGICNKRLGANRKEHE